MKKLLSAAFLFFVISCLNAGTGEGMSYSVNNFHLEITWPWHEKYDFVEYGSFLNLTFIINDNYSLIEKTNRSLWLDCGIDSNGNYLIVCYELKGNKDYGEVKKIIIKDHKEFFKNIENFVITFLNFKKEYKKECVLFVAFIPNDYLDIDNIHKDKLNKFLQKSELSLAHNMAIQNNMQGYVYSIFFSKEAMYKALNELDAGRVIINKRFIDEFNDKWFYNIDLTLFD